MEGAHEIAAFLSPSLLPHISISTAFILGHAGMPSSRVFALALFLPPFLPFSLFLPHMFSYPPPPTLIFLLTPSYVQIGRLRLDVQDAGGHLRIRARDRISRLLGHLQNLHRLQKGPEKKPKRSKVSGPANQTPRRFESKVQIKCCRAKSEPAHARTRWTQA